MHNKVAARSRRDKPAPLVRLYAVGRDESEAYMSSDLQREFDAVMMSIYVRALREADYPAHRYHQMLCDHGGLETAKRLINASNVSEGYTALWERKRLDLTVEALVQDKKWRELFTEEELNRALKRLRDYGYSPLTG